MQRAAEGDVHLLQAAADAEQRNSTSDAGLRQRKRNLVALDVIGLVLGMRLGLEAGRMNIGARARQHDAVDHVEQSADIGNLRTASKHQRQGASHLGHGAHIALADHLHVEAAFDAVGVSDHADDRLPPHASSSSPNSKR
jgi:hypothetical protein